MTLFAAGPGHVIDHRADIGIIGVRGGDEPTLEIGIELFQDLPSLPAARHVQQGLLGHPDRRVRRLRRHDHRPGGDRVGSGDDPEAIGQILLGNRLADRPGVKFAADDLFGDGVLITVVAVLPQVVEVDAGPGDRRGTAARYWISDRQRRTSCPAGPRCR